MHGATLAVGLVLAAGVFAVDSTTAVGGLVLAGVGFGTTYTPSGEQFCAGHPLHVEAFYLPNSKGILYLTYEGGLGCAQNNGGALFVGRLANGHPASLEFICNGTERTGLFCEGTSGGQLLKASIGPYLGAGSQVSAYYDDSKRIFIGLFTAF
jgi:hypothetical protein